MHHWKYQWKWIYLRILPKIRDLDLTQYFADMQSSPQLRPTQPPAGADIESVMDAGLRTLHTSDSQPLYSRPRSSGLFSIVVLSAYSWILRLILGSFWPFIFYCKAGQVIQSYNDQIMIESCEIFTGLGKFTISSHKQQVSNGSNSALWENVRG